MEIGRIIIVCGIILLILGSMVILGGKYNIIGKMPGDLLLDKENIKIYFPITSMLLISLTITIVYNIINRILK